MKPSKAATLLLVLLTASSEALTIPRERLLQAANNIIDRGANSIDSIGAGTPSHGTSHPLLSRANESAPSERKTALYADTLTCDANQVRVLNHAIDEVGRLAQAARNSLFTDFMARRGNPAAYFFGDTPDPRVDHVFADAIEYTKLQVPPDAAALRSATVPATPFDAPIRITCSDELDLCRHKPRGHAYYTSRTSRIVLCPIFWPYPNLIRPCHGGLSKDGLTGIGSQSRAQLLLHEFTHALTDGGIRDAAYGTKDSHDLLVQYRSVMQEDAAVPARSCWFCIPASKRLPARDKWLNPALNADSYARFASWAFDLGLGTIGTDEQITCLDMFRPAATPGAGESTTDPYFTRLRNPPPSPGAQGSIVGGEPGEPESFWSSSDARSLG